MMNRYVLVFIGIIFHVGLWAQPQEGEQALLQVLEILAGKKETPLVERKTPLKKGAWEALSYLEEKAGVDYTTEDLLEAVPDYYNFRENNVLIKLINPQNYNEYGLELELPYRVEEKTISLFDKEGKVKDSWIVLYLDDNYMALDMGELRVFFTHTPAQE